MKRRKVVVIGGGVVGLCTAYYLLQEGHQVTVIDKGKLGTGASYVNAGYLTPSHIIPMAAPGMVAKGFQWMFNSSSPFYIKPRLDGALFHWGFKFIKSCTQAHVKQSMQAILDNNLLSKQLYLELQKSDAFDFHMETKGLLMAYKTTEAEKEEAKVVAKARDLGLTVSQLSREEILKMQNELISERDYQKLQNQFESQYVNSNSSVAGIASSLATYYLLYDNVNLINEQIDIYRSITREEIQSVAQKYLSPNQRVEIEYLPGEEVGEE